MNRKIDIGSLKAKHRLESVMEETGEQFKINAVDPDQWCSLKTLGLKVDIRRQTWQLQKPDMDIETGDVIAWLQRRYSWDFKKAITFLQGRAPDSKSGKHPAIVELNKPVGQGHEDITRSLDKWQEEALQLGGERMRSYFSWSWIDIVLNNAEVRIEPTIAPDVATCPRCGKDIDLNFKNTQYSKYDNWGNTSFMHAHFGEIPIVAYSIKRRLNLSDLGLDGKKEFQKILSEANVDPAFREKIETAIDNFLGGMIDQLDSLFAEEEDSVVCPMCAWKELDFQRALLLCRKSARQRSEVAYEERIASELEK